MDFGPVKKPTLCPPKKKKKQDEPSAEQRRLGLTRPGEGVIRPEEVPGHTPEPRLGPYLERPPFEPGGSLYQGGGPLLPPDMSYYTGAQGTQGAQGAQGAQENQVEQVLQLWSMTGRSLRRRYVERV